MKCPNCSSTNVGYLGSWMEHGGSPVSEKFVDSKSSYQVKWYRCYKCTHLFPERRSK